VIEQITYLMFLRRLDDLFPEVEVDEMIATIRAVNATAMPA